MKKITKWLIDQKAIVMILMLLWVLFGLYSYYITPKQENPDSSVSGVIITTIYPGASTEDVEQMVSIKIEDALSTVPNIETLDSISMNSASIVVVLFDVDVDEALSIAELRQVIDDVQTDLPKMCQESTINVDLSASPQFIIALSGDNYSQEDLVSYGVEIKEAISEVDGVTKIDIDGELDKEVIVEVNISALDLYDISIESISQVLQGQNLSIPSGSLEYESGVINIKTPATFSSLKDIEDIVLMSSSEDMVGFVQLKDIAEVYIDYTDGYRFEQDGKNAILISGFFDDGINAVLVGEDVREVLESSKDTMPPDVDFYEVMYSPEDIDQSVTDFIMNLLQSIVLIIVVVMIGVRLKNALIVSLALPLSILTTFIAMYLMGIEFHFISIMALIISLGILVDNAIVISDAIQQKLNEDYEKMEAINLAISETATPILTSTLTTIITFGILFFVPGTVGEVVATIPIVVVTALVASYIVAMFIIPIFASMIFEKESFHKIERKPSIIKSMFNKGLALGLKYKKTTLIVAFSTLIVAAILVFSLGLVFFPYSEKPIIYMNIKSETLNLDKTEKITEQIHEIMDEYDEIVSYSTAIGRGLPRFFLTVPTAMTSDNFAQIMLEMDYTDSEYDSNEKIGYELQQRFDSEVVGADVEVKYLEYAMPTDAKIAIEVISDDLADIKKVSNNIQEALLEIEGTTNVRDNSVGNEYEYIVDIDTDLATMMGIIKYDIVKQINTALMGAETSIYTVGGTEMPIIVKSNIRKLDDLYRLPIMSSAVKDTQILLDQVATISLESVIPTINRSKGKRTITVMSDIKPGYSSSTIESEFKEIQNQLLIDGVEISFAGEMTQMMELLSNLILAAGVAIVLIYIILLLQFQCFEKPFIILMSIPLSFIGSFLGLYIFKMDLQAMALLGLVSLIGVVVNNGIILVEVMDSEIENGSTVLDACQSAVDKRYRAITLGTITTCIGLVPLILSGDPMSSPMASVLLFGLLFSTILTMIIVPVMYSMMEQEKLENVNIDSLSKKELKKYAKHFKIKHYHKMDKQKIIDALSNTDDKELKLF